MGHLSNRVLQRLLRIGLTLDHLRESLQNQLFALNWILSGSRSNLMTGYFNKAYLEVAGFFFYFLFLLARIRRHLGKFC